MHFWKINTFFFCTCGVVKGIKPWKMHMYCRDVLHSSEGAGLRCGTSSDLQGTGSGAQTLKPSVKSLPMFQSMYTVHLPSASQFPQNYGKENGDTLQNRIRSATSRPAVKIVGNTYGDRTESEDWYEHSSLLGNQQQITSNVTVVHGTLYQLQVHYGVHLIPQDKLIRDDIPLFLTKNNNNNNLKKVYINNESMFTLTCIS